MNPIGIFVDLFRHMAWADALIWQSVLSNPAAVADRTMRERLHHIHLCQQAWLRIWLHQSVDSQAGASLGMRNLASWARKYHEDVAQYFASVQEQHLGIEIAVPGMEQEISHPYLWETILQITMHSTYHRGQVSLRLREIGGEPPQTDFIKWVVSGKPNATWPDTEELEEKAEGSKSL